jgi:ketosteroid isomerase-like protein
MKPHRLPPLTAFAALALAPLAFASARLDAQSDPAREVIETLEAMWAAIEAGDADAYASYVHPDFTQFGENDVYLAEGKDLEVRSIADYVRRASNVHTEMHQPRVTIRGDVAWITYYWTDSGYSGGERFASRGKSTRIFVREDGRWLCIHGHYTAVP